MKIYCCEDRAESILSGIYDAWADPVPNREIRLLVGQEAQLSFLDELAAPDVTYEKAAKVMDSIGRKLGPEVLRYVEGALSASAADKADALFQFLQYAFPRAASARFLMNDLNAPEVMRVFELNRKSRNEAHLLLGFLRFAKLSDALYYAKIGPVNDVLPLIADHFAERFNTQAFLIYDEKRQKSVVYAPGTNWYFVEGEMNLPERELARRDGYEALWKTFFDTIAIKERLNPVCQRTHCPIHFRAYMNEFNIEKG